MVKKLLLIFVKNPQRGRVKTRLADAIGNEKALQVYRELLSITKSVTDRLDCAKQVWYSRFVDEEDQWPADEYEKKLQKGDDLGERMKYAFREGFGQGYNKVVIIGSDCAELEASFIQKAFDGLDEYDLVVGPSKDGGYYLLGMNSLLAELFDEKEWGTSTVLEQTLNQIKDKGFSFKLLPALNDIDTEEDLKKATQLSI
jgi:rSAM/selenodomain-associated transferase 1